MTAKKANLGSINLRNGLADSVDAAATSGANAPLASQAEAEAGVCKS